MGTWKGGREKAPAAFCRKVHIGLFSILDLSRATSTFFSTKKSPVSLFLSSDNTCVGPCQVICSSEELEMWGDGKQTRSFCYVDDCVEGKRHHT